MASLADNEISEFIIHEVKPTTILVLLTSCQGTWPDIGFGGVLKKIYPAAYGRYQTICAEHFSPKGRPTDSLAGSCHIISPLPADYVDSSVPPVYIACLFSSFGDGHRNWFSSKPGRSSQEKIRSQTASAFQQMREQLREMGRDHAQEASRLAGAEMINGKLQRTYWTEEGNNMKVCFHRDNGEDFQMDWGEVSSIYYDYFRDWEGERLFVKKRPEPRPKPSPAPRPSPKPSPVRRSSPKYDSGTGSSSTRLDVLHSSSAASHSMHCGGHHH